MYAGLQACSSCIFRYIHHIHHTYIHSSYIHVGYAPRIYIHMYIYTHIHIHIHTCTCSSIVASLHRQLHVTSIMLQPGCVVSATSREAWKLVVLFTHFICMYLLYTMQVHVGRYVCKDWRYVCSYIHNLTKHEVKMQYVVTPLVHLPCLHTSPVCLPAYLP